MIKFISKLIKSIFTLLVAFVMFAFIYSAMNNISFETTISYFKTLGYEIIGILGSEELPANSNVDYTQIITSSNKYFYYEQLDSNGKIIYSALENNIDNLKKGNYIMDFSSTFNDLLHESLGQYRLNKSFQSALDAFFYDHPEIFYIDITKISLVMNSISLGPVTTYTVQIAPKDGTNYLSDNFRTEQEVNAAIKKLENVKEDILYEIENKNLYNKILAVHDMLVNSIEYDSTYSQENSYNIYGALVEKQVVCEGYAKAFKYMMDSLDVECILVSGTAINSSNQSESHMWNYVKLDDNWYGVDVTWDDPIVIGGYSNNVLRRTYFLKGRQTFITSHSPTGKISETGMLFEIPSLSTSNYIK